MFHLILPNIADNKNITLYMFARLYIFSVICCMNDTRRSRTLWLESVKMQQQYDNLITNIC